MDKTVIMAFSVNDTYVPYLEVAIQSIEDNSNSLTQYKIFILFKTLADDNKQKIKETVSLPNFEVSFICVSKYFDGNLFVQNGSAKYLSEECYYRLALPELLQEYDKVIYLDCDIVALTDISELFEYEIENEYFAAVLDFADQWKCYSDKSDIYIYRKNELNMVQPEMYFNSGVLLFNLKKLREDYSLKEILDIAQMKNWEKHDQDVLNLLAKGNVKWLDIQWNLIECMCREALSAKDKEYYFMQQKTPKIIHFASRKPWIFSDVFGQEEFWKYASKTPDFMQCIKSISGCDQLKDSKILQQYLDEALKEQRIGLPFLLQFIKMWIKNKFRYI